MGQQRQCRRDRRARVSDRAQGRHLARAGRDGAVCQALVRLRRDTDGWQDLSHNFKLDNEFAAAPNGNIALTGEIDLSARLPIHRSGWPSAARSIAR